MQFKAQSQKNENKNMKNYMAQQWLTDMEKNKAKREETKAKEIATDR